MSVNERPETFVACHRFGSHGAALVFFGTLLSGPVALLVVNSTQPEPAWGGPRPFIEHYHPIQTLPFVFGFVLVGGFVALVAALFSISKAEHRARTAAALTLTAAFAAMILTNYVLQTTFGSADVGTLVAHDPTTSG